MKVFPGFQPRTLSQKELKKIKEIGKKYLIKDEHYIYEFYAITETGDIVLTAEYPRETTN